jgi:hypothetical protein
MAWTSDAMGGVLFYAILLTFLVLLPVFIPA